MNWRTRTAGCVVCLACTVRAGLGQGPAAPPAASPDDRLQAARQFVEASDRYMHHDKLKRDMEGYGLTVLAGDEIVKFNLKIISVLTKWGPHQDVILARLSGQNLEHTGIVAGMSGSPCYVRDPADGKDKLIGAVAYGWRGQKDPLAGIQPITQMLAAGSFFRQAGKGDAKAAATAGPAPSLAAGSGAPEALEAFLARVLDPRKIDFVDPPPPSGPARQGDAVAGPAGQDLAGPQLVPLVTPLMVSGVRASLLPELARQLAPMGIVPVASGGVGRADAKAVGQPKLIPGAAVGVPLVTGDADMSAVGTVTEVVGDRLLAFGHSFAAEGDAELPLGPAYIHTVVASLFGSFKLTSGLGVAGTLIRDENTAIGGVVGPKPAMVPMTVVVEWAEPKRTEVYRFHIAKHRRLTANLARSLLFDTAGAWHDLPERHIVTYSVVADYGKLGKYQASNISTNSDISPALSDLTRPLYALINNPFDPPVHPERIEVRLRAQKGDLSAAMIDLKLDGDLYRPGETVTGRLSFRPYRKPKQTMPVRFKLPDDLPDGSFALTVCDATAAMSRYQSEMPQRFTARSTAELFEALQRVVEPAAKQLYLRMPVPDGGGLALAQRELPDLPDGKARILAQAAIPEAKAFTHAVVQTIQTDYIISGSLSAGLRVQREPGQTILRQ